MNQPIKAFQLIKPVSVPLQSLSQYSGLRTTVQKLVEHTQVTTKYLQDYMGQVKTQLNSQVQGIGDALATAATVSVSAPTHHITGTGTIATIVPPSGFSGPLWLVSDDGFTLGAGGNISDAPIFVAAGLAILLDYDPTPMLWYPPTGLSTDGQTVTNEVPSGTIDGVNAVFTLSKTPRTGSVALYRNGLRQSVAAGDYMIVGKTITFAAPLDVGDVLISDYRY